MNSRTGDETMFTRAIVRRPGANFARGLTTANLGTPDFSLILRQHRAYVQALETIGLDVIILEADPDHPDAYFVEDTAVVAARVAVITRPGALSRRGEEDAIEPVLAGFRKTARIRPPGTIDGGDVLMVRDRFFIGLSERTNAEGARQVGQILEAHGYSWTTISVGTGLHLKSSVNHLGQGILVVTEAMAVEPAFKDFKKVVLDEADSYAANTLWINGRLLTPAGFPGVRKKLADLCLPIIELEASEFRKMDGGLTCLSLRF
jgi:dimethylargininase